MRNLIKNLIHKNKKSAIDSATFLAFAFCVAGLATLVADLFYQPKIVKKRGYEIEMSLDGKAVVKKEEKIIDFAEFMISADIERGAKIFKKCASCHNVGKGEGAKVGPALYAVLGRARGSFAGFSYSEAMKAKGGAWGSFRSR